MKEKSFTTLTPGVNVLKQPFPVWSKNLRGKLEPTKVEHHSDVSLLGKLQILPENVRLGWKQIAKYKHSSLVGSVTKKKSFIRLTPGVNVLKLFSFIADDEAK